MYLDLILGLKGQIMTGKINAAVYVDTVLHERISYQSLLKSFRNLRKIIFINY